MKKQQALFNFLGALFLLGNVVLIIMVLYYRPLNIDGGFFLPMARDLSVDPQSISNLKGGYTPLVIMIFAFFIEYFKISDFSFFIFLVVLIQVFNAAILTSISHKLISKKKSLLHFLFQFYLFFQFSLEGLNIILEPWVIFFLLLAIFSIIRIKGKKALLLSGIFCGLSFMCKQYGLASLTIVISFMFLVQKVRFSILPILNLLFGFFLSTVSIIIVYKYQLKLNVTDDLSLFSAAQYYGHRSILKSFIGFSKFLVFITPYFLVLLLWGINKRTVKNRIFLFVIFSVLLFSPAFYFKQYLHNFHLVLPFIILISLKLFIDLPQSKKLNRLLIFSIIVSISWSIRAHYVSSSISKTKQQEQSQLFKKHIPEDAIVYISNNKFQPFRYLCNLTPPLKQIFGYGFVDNFNDSINQEMIKNSDFLILKSDTIYPNFQKIQSLKNIGFIYKKEDLE